MYKFLTLPLCLFLAACANTQPNAYSPSVDAGKNLQPDSTLTAIHDKQAIPRPITQAELTSQLGSNTDEAGLSIGNSLSSYRVFSLILKKGERYQVNIHTKCSKQCLGVSPDALKPRVMVLDAYGTVLTDKPTHITAAVGQISHSWKGEANEDGTYYLLINVENDIPGQTVVINDVWIDNSPLMAVKTSLQSSSANFLNNQSIR